MSKLDENQMIKKNYMCPEIICDLIQSRLDRLGIELSYDTYAHIRNDVERRNEALGLRPITEEEYAELRRLNLIQ